MTTKPTRGSSVLDAEILWLFTESAGELGLRAMPLEPSIGAESDGEPSERQVEAAGRQRRILSALYSLSHDDQALLRLAHLPMPPGLRPRLVKLGELAAVCMWLAESPADVLAWLQNDGRRGHDAETSKLSSLRMRAFHRVVAALQRYREARKLVQALERTTRQRRHDEFMRGMRAPRAAMHNESMQPRHGKAGAWPTAARRKSA